MNAESPLPPGITSYKWFSADPSFDESVEEKYLLIDN